MKIGAVRRIGNKFRHETRASIADGEGNLMILRGAFELDFARPAFFTAVANSVRHAFGKGKQHIVPHVIGYARAVELPARPFVDLLQLVEPAGYEEMIHVTAAKFVRSTVA